MELFRLGRDFIRSPQRARRWRRTSLAVELLEDRTLLSAGGIHILGTPNDPSFKSQWDMVKISANSAWDTTTGSMKIVVADIDTGIDYTHPDLYKNVWINQGEIPSAIKSGILANFDDGDGLITFRDLNDIPEADWATYSLSDSNDNDRIDAADILEGWDDDSATDDGNGYIDDLVGWDFANNDNNPFDDNGHGTHTAGTIGAMGNNGVGMVGVNWQVQIMAVKAFDAKGSGDLNDAADAIRYAAANGARVTNNSWGFYDSGEKVTGTKYSYLYNAIRDTSDVLFVAAAGNNSVNNDSSWARAYPASYNLGHIISVAATTIKDTRASFSNYGSTTVDLGAPGHNVLSTVPGGYAYYSGTSMAAPHVTGAAALVLAKNSALNANDVKSAILNGVDKINSMNKTVTGGRLNLAKTLAGVAAGTAQTNSTEAEDTGSGSDSKAKGRSGTQSISSADPLADDQAATKTFSLIATSLPGQLDLTQPVTFVATRTSFAPVPSTVASQTTFAWMAAGSGASALEIEIEDTEIPDWPMWQFDIASLRQDATPPVATIAPTFVIQLQQEQPAPLNLEATDETPIHSPAAAPAAETRQQASPSEAETRAAPASRFTRTLANLIGLVGAFAFFGYVSVDRARERTEKEKAARKPI